MARTSRPSNRPFASRVAWLVLASCVQLAVLLWAARAHIEQALNCEVCDTFYYYNVAAAFADAGLLFSNPYDGYRSYFVPFVIAGVAKLAAAPGLSGEPVVRYAYGVSILFWAASLGLMIWLARRASIGTFVLTTVATPLNPFLIVYVPFALQEGVLMICCLPLLFLWVGAKGSHPARRAALVLAMTVLAYVIRAALAWWLFPAAAYAAWLLWKHRPDARAWLPWMTGVLLGAVVVIGPQVYISKQHSHSFDPYPSTTVFSQQIPIGITLLKFATVEDEGHWRGLTYWSPYVAEQEKEKTFANFYLRLPCKYCGPLARSGKFGKSEDSERRLGRAQATLLKRYFRVSGGALRTASVCLARNSWSFLSMAASARARIATAASAALAAPASPIASVGTGMPFGICTVESSESRPPRCFEGIGTPSTGSVVCAATTPARCAAPPAAAMMTFMPLPFAAPVQAMTAAGVRCADMAFAS